MVVDLPAYENDVLTALTETGGLPGFDAKNEISIERHSPEAPLPSGMHSGAGMIASETATVAAGAQGSEPLVIPLRIRKNAPLPFKPSDVVLHEGDVVHIEAREAWMSSRRSRRSVALLSTGVLMPTI
jgi:hypothetical protein